MSNYYQILGLDKTCSQTDIKKAYRNLCLKYHPDKNNSEEAQELFNDISKAYHVLSDDNQRKNYDESGVGVEGNIIDPFEIFNEMMKDDDIPDIIVKVPLTMQELIYGITKDVNFERYSLCNTCNGAGVKSKIISDCLKCKGKGVILEFIDNNSDSGKPFSVNEKICDMCCGNGIDPECELCENCNGNKYVIENLETEIDIPAGAYDQYYLTFENEGNYIPETKERSKLIIVIKEEEDDKFSRGVLIKELGRMSMADILYEMDISFEESLAGIKKRIDYFDNYIDIKIKGIINNQDIYVLKKYGLPVIDENDDREYGDLFIRFNVKKPDISDDKIEKILKILKYKDKSKIKSKDCEKLISYDKFIKKQKKE